MPQWRLIPQQLGIPGGFLVSNTVWSLNGNKVHRKDDSIRMQERCPPACSEAYLKETTGVVSKIVPENASPYVAFVWPAGKSERNLEWTNLGKVLIINKRSLGRLSGTWLLGSHLLEIIGNRSIHNPNPAFKLCLQWIAWMPNTSKFDYCSGLWIWCSTASRVDSSAAVSN